MHDEGDTVVGPDHAHRPKAAHGDRLDLPLTLLTRGPGHRRIVTETTVIDQAVGNASAGQESAIRWN